MKSFGISMAIGLCMGCFATVYGQETVEYQVTASEYEALKNSPDKLREIQSNGYQIVVKDDVNVEISSEKQIESITPHEMSSYQQTPAKLSEFENSTNGDYVVKPNPVLNMDRPTQPLSDQDLMKLRLENQTKNQSKEAVKHADGSFGFSNQEGLTPVRGKKKVKTISADGQKSGMRSVDRVQSSKPKMEGGNSADGQ